MSDFSLHSARFWYGFASVVAQCFLSLVGVILLPLQGKPVYKYVIQTMAAFAVGALLANAIVHLIPHAIGAGEQHLHDDKNEAVVGILSGKNQQRFGLGESFEKYNQQNSRPNRFEINTGPFVKPPQPNDFHSEALHRHRRHIEKSNFLFDSASNTSASNNDLANNKSSSVSGRLGPAKDHTPMYRMLVTLATILVFFVYHSLTHKSRHTTNDEILNPQRANCHRHSAVTTKPRVENSTNNNFTIEQRSCTATINTSDTAHVESLKTRTGFSCYIPHVRNVSRRAFMVLIGDAIHNFADGLATAAAFAAGNEQGVTTSVAIVCHETAHEVGDFAILLHSGMSFSGALFFNFLGSMSAIAGYLTGAVIVGSLQQDAFVLWILALTAGIFIYIALVDMLPELIEQQNGRFALLFMQLVAIISGIAVVTIVEVVMSH